MKKLLLSLLLITGTTLSAQTWVQQNTGFTTASRGISDIYPVDANTVWALAYDGITPANVIYDFTRTINGGTTWTPGTVQVGAGLTITNLAPANGTTAWAGAFNPTTGVGGVYKTTDGGATWTPQNTTAYGEGSWFNFVHAFDANTAISGGDPIGVGVGDFEMYKTTDGGATWTRIPGASLPNPNLPIASEFGYNGAFSAIGSTLAFCTDGGRIFKTHDMGVTWTAHQSPLTDFGSAAINGKLYLSNADTAMILGTSNSGTTYRLYTCTNFSSATPTWSTGTVYTSTLRNLAYVPNTTGIVAVGPTGSAYSPNNGSTFTTIDAVQKTAVGFLNVTTGWAGGFNTSATVGGIFKFSGNLGVNDVTANKAMSAAPNPTNGLLQLVDENSSIVDVTVFDILGKQVYNHKFNALSEVNLDLTQLQSGAYILKATNNVGATQTLKIMKN